VISLIHMNPCLGSSQTEFKLLYLAYISSLPNWLVDSLSRVSMV